LTLHRLAIAGAPARLRESPVAGLVALGVLSRVYVTAVAWAAGATLPSTLEDGWNSGTLFLRYFARWDSGFYMAIAREGYGFKPEAWALAVYADSLFLALALGTLLLAHRGRWLAAGAVASLAAVTRPTGVVLLGALGLALLLAFLRDRRLPWTGFAALPVALALPAAFALYSRNVTGDAFVGIHVREATWPTVRWHDPLTILEFSGSPPVIAAHVYAYVAFLVTVVGWVVFDLARRRRTAALPVYAFTLVLAVVYLAYSDVVPIVRYLLPVVPAYWMIADVARSGPGVAGAVAVLAPLTALVAALFATWASLY
jgi:hypothetical protein